MAANVYLTGSPWESDLINITPAHYYTEFEIKISRADFNADFRKRAFSTTKHDLLQNKINPAQRDWGFTNNYPRPKQFYFVVLEGVCEAKDVPKHCGLIIFRQDRFRPYRPGLALEIVTQAPRLKDPTKLKLKHIHNLAVKLGSRIG